MKTVNLGLQDRVEIINKNLLDVDVSRADVVYLYSTTTANSKVKPKLEAELRKGTRVVSHDYKMSGWQPVKVERFCDHPLGVSRYTLSLCFSCDPEKVDNPDFNLLIEALYIKQLILEDENRMKGKYCIPLDEKTVLRLPYYAPSANCVHLYLKEKRKQKLQICLQERETLFTISLSRSIDQLKDKEISEIRYDCGEPGSIRICLDEEGNLGGEYSCRREKSLMRFVKKLSVF